jgi:hypothetical protein
LTRINVKLDNGHGGYGPNEVRIKGVEERFRYLRKIVVNLQMDASGEEGETLQQPLDVRILAVGRLKHQARGVLRIFLSELSS